MQVKKFAKWGLALTSTLVLGGVVGPVGGQLLNTTDVVYAQEQENAVVDVISFDDASGDEIKRRQVVIKPGETVEIWPEEIAGYKFVKKYGDKVIITYAETVIFGLRVPLYYYYVPTETPAEQPVEIPAETPVEKSVETPTDKPVETPVEQPAEVPVETPAEQPVEQPVEQPAETPTGKPVEQPAEQPAEVPAEQPVEIPAETPVEKPVEQPVEVPAETPTDKPAETPVEQLGETSAEQPVEKPIEQPVEQPADTPTDKPVEQPKEASSLTDQAAGSVQTVEASDKKKVDNSTPSTPAIKPQEVSQPVAKTLPKTGDSSSMLLVLGGVLSGLSGLGLAATSRKRD
ncbi:TPA: LPXTG cell wall anchor domain-containing protein [Streptococcus suis]|nr:LPXTG cell wall anchor domain-containing protein [Streptococcus suis]